MFALLTACLFMSVAALAVAALLALNAFRKQHQNEIYETMYLGTIISSVFYFFPFYCEYFSMSSIESFVKSFFLSIHHAIRLFLVDASYDELRVFSSSFDFLGDIYAAFGIVLFLIAPALTVTVVVSCLQRAFITLRIRLNFQRVYYIFSEVNLQSVYLAQDIRGKYPRANIVFLGVEKENKKVKAALQHLSPMLLPLDCMEMNQLMVRYRKDAIFFIIGEDNEVNSAQVISILDETPSKSNREIYVRLSQNDHLLDNLPAYENTHVYRIEHINSLVLHNLGKLGTRLFEGAKPDENGNKVISLLVVGLGQTGSALVKNLSWFTQIEGYTTVIHAFEQDDIAIEKFRHSCPGFFDDSGKNCNCEIIIHPRMISGTPAFESELCSLGDVGFVFVALGSDQLNVSAALDIRRTFQKQNMHPPIQAVLRNDDTGKLLSNSKTVRGASYGIEFIGSYKSIYTLDFITDVKSKEQIVRDTIRWVDQKQVGELLSHEEEYRRQKARTMHKKLMCAMNITGEEACRSYHRQWVNQKLSEGYVWGRTRDDIAKTHEVLVPYDELPEEYKRIDF